MKKSPLYFAKQLSANFHLALTTFDMFYRITYWPLPPSSSTIFSYSSLPPYSSHPPFSAQLPPSPIPSFYQAPLSFQILPTIPPASSFRIHPFIHPSSSFHPPLLSYLQPQRPPEAEQSNSLPPYTQLPPPSFQVLPSMPTPSFYVPLSLNPTRFFPLAHWLPSSSFYSAPHSLLLSQS